MKLILFIFLAHIATCAAAFLLSTRWQEASRTRVAVAEKPPLTLPSGMKVAFEPVEERVDYGRTIPIPLVLYAVAGFLAVLVAVALHLWRTNHS